MTDTSTAPERARIPLPGQAAPVAGRRRSRDVAALPRWLAAIRSHAILVPVLALVIAQGLLFVVLVPPWQAPDEPAHLQAVRVYEGLDRRERERVVAEIFASMWEFSWWGYVGAPLPDRVPRGFAEERYFGSGIEQFDRQPPLYYWAAAKLLATLRDQPDVLTDLLLARLASVAWLALAAAGGYAAGWVAFGDRRFAVATAVLVAALPMPAYIGSSVNNDTAATAVGAWASVPILSFVQGQRRLLSLGLAVGGLGVALLTKSTVLTALVFALGLAVLVVASSWLRPRQRWIALGAAGAVVVAAGFALIGGETVAAWRAEPAGGPGLISSDARTGSRALALDRGAPGSYSVVQSLPIADVRRLRGRTVSLTTYATGPAGAAVTVGVNDGVGRSFSTVPLGEEWVPIRVIHQVAPAATYVQAIVAPAGSAAAIVSRVDDASLREEAPGGPGDELLLNGGFEVARPVPRELPFRSLGDGLDGNNVQFIIDPLHWAPPILGDYAYLLGQLHLSFWGSYGWLVRPIPDGWASAILLIELATLGAAVVALVRRGTPARRRGVLALWLALLPLLLLTALVRALPPDPFGVVGSPQGRYLFPALGLLMTGALVAWRAALPARVGALLPACVVIAVPVFSAASWAFVILPYFYAQ